MANTKSNNPLSATEYALQQVGNNVIDIRKTGPLTYRQLQQLNNNLPDESPNYYNNDFDSALLKSISKTPGFRNVPVSDDYDIGESMFDQGLYNAGELEDYQDIRAENQPWYAQIGAGVAKMGILAGTTFVDGLVGTIAGLLNLGADAVQGNIHNPKDALWSFIDNPFSEAMQQINEWGESVLPNYYSRDEQESPWYTQIGTANFIGDKFLKNLGFTIGAAGAAMVSAGLGSKALINSEIRNAFKGVVVNAAGKELKTGAQIYKAYRAGDAFMDGAKLTEDLAKSAKQLKNAEMKLKLIGGITAAAGEGRIEAITNANDWEKNIVNHLDEQHAKYKQGLVQKIYEEHPEYFGTDAQGNITIENPIALQEFNDKMKVAEDNYEKARAEISEKKAAVGNSIFGLNLALLSVSNIWQFGRAMTGGYTAGRTARNLVKGSMQEGFTANKAVARAKRIRALSNPLMEAQEEMSQAGISEGSGLWGSQHINNQFGSFYGSKIDPDAEEGNQTWLGNILKGFANSYGSIDRWEEGFIGGLTGLLGIPKIKRVTKENGKKGLKLQMDGELYEGLREAKNISRDAEDVAAYLNKRIQDPEFVNYYQGMLRHNSYQATMDGALDVGDEFEYKNAKHSQMVSDAIMFDKAGRLQDLYDMINEAANVSSNDVKTLRQLSVDKKSGKSIYDDMTDEQVVEHVKKQAGEMKQTVDKYKEISTNLKTLYGENIDSDVLEELTWGMTQVDNWESRVKDIQKSMRGQLADKAQVLKDKYDIDVNVVLNNITDFVNNLSDEKNIIEEINNIINDKNLTVEEGRAKIEAAIKENKEAAKQNDLALGREILKLRRKYKASVERLEKQREKALAQIEKLKPEQQRLRDLRNDEVADYNEYAEQAKSTLKGVLSALRQVKNLKKFRKGRGFYNEAFDEYEAQLKEQLQQLEEGRVDIFHSFRPILDEIDAQLAWAEAASNTDRVLDKRFKKGYDPNSRLVVIGSKSADGTQMVSEAEAEARHNSKQRKYDLLGELMDLMDALNDTNNKFIDPLNVARLNEQIIDLSKILAVRTKFIDDYYALSEHPELFQSKLQEKIQSAIAAHVEKQVNSGVELFDKVKSLKELKEAISTIDNPSYIPQIFEKIKEGDNDELKSIIDNYIDIEDMRQVIFGDDESDGGIVGSISMVGEAEESMIKYSEAANLIEDVLSNSESLKEAKEKLGKTIIDNKKEEGDNLLAEALEKILDRYDELSKSSNSKRSDKKARKKIKEESEEEGKKENKKGKKPSHFMEDDELSTEEDTSTEDNEDNDSETKPRLSSKRKSHVPENNEETDDNDDDSKTDDELEEIILFDENDNEIDDEVDNDNEEDLDSPAEVKSEDIDIVKTLKGLSEEDLDDVIDGNSDLLEGLNSKDKKSVKELAERIKQEKKTPSVHNSSKGGNAEFDLEPAKKGNSVHRSWAVTNYDIDSLKDRKKRAAVPFDHPTAKALRKLGAYNFVDSGRLGILLNENPDLPIHYITAPSKEGLEKIVLLAIEVTDDVEEVGTLNPIKASDGKYYQVVGSLGFNASDKKASTNYHDIVDGLEEERKSLPKSDYIVSQKYVNTVSHIYSGRMVKSTTGNSNSEVLSLKKLLNGEKPHFGIWYNEVEFKTPTLGDERVVKPNSNNANPRAGSLWLMTREADGRYYAKAIQIKRFTNEEWNFAEHEGTPIMQAIKDNLSIIANPEASDYERAIAKLDLESILYFPSKVVNGKKNQAQFFFTDDVVSLKDENGNTIANNIGKGKSIEEKVEDMISELEKLNLRFQVSASRLSKENASYTKTLLDSDILSADLAMVHNVNASFDLPLLDPRTGNPILNAKDSDITGHTGKRGIQSKLSTTTIQIGTKRYSLDDEGNVTLNDTEVKDQNVIDEVIFRDKINQGLVQPIKGNPNLYIDTYSSGEEYGIFNGKLKTGDELEELKDKAAKKVKEDKQAKAAKTLADKLRSREEEESIDDEEEALFNEGKSNSSAFEKLFGKKAEVTEDESTEDEEDALFEEGRSNSSAFSKLFGEEISDEKKDDFARATEEDSYEEDDDNLGEEDDDVFFFGDESNDNDVFDENKDEDEDNEEEDKPSSKFSSTPQITLDETFTPSSTTTSPKDFNKLMLKNRSLLKNEGLSFAELKTKAAKLGIDLNSITTQEKFEGLLNQIRCKG